MVLNKHRKPGYTLQSSSKLQVKSIESQDCISTIIFQGRKNCKYCIGSNEMQSIWDENLSSLFVTITFIRFWFIFQLYMNVYSHVFVFLFNDFLT